MPEIAAPVAPTAQPSEFFAQGGMPVVAALPPAAPSPFFAQGGLPRVAAPPPTLGERTFPGLDITPPPLPQNLVGLPAAEAPPPSPPQPVAPAPPPPAQAGPTTVTDPADIALLGRIGVQAEFRPSAPTRAANLYQGPTGQVGPNEFVVTDRADVALINRVVPGANVFFANPITGELWADSGIMAFVPALNQYLAGEELPDSVVEMLVRVGLLEESGAVTDAGTALGGGGRSIIIRAPVLSGNPGRFSGTRGAAIGLVNWRV